MNSLIAYHPNLLNGFSVRADLQSQSPSIIAATFEIENRNSEVDFKALAKTVDAANIRRQDELWKNICFEFFLNPVDEKKYYEFNFSLAPAWNCYVFESYRTPQPPQASSDFQILNLTWTGAELKVSLKNNSMYKNFNVGITAIIKDTADQTHYFALKHAGPKPDFHLHDSFILQRGF